MILTPFCACFGGGERGGLVGWFWEGLQKVWSNNNFSLFLTFIISDRARMFVQAVMVVERGNANVCLVFFKY